MQTSNKKIRPRDRSLDPRTIVFGATVFLVLCMFFSLGFYVIGPRLRSTGPQHEATASAPSYVPPSGQRQGLSPGVQDEEEQEDTPKLDLEVTEHVEEETPSGEQTDDESDVSQDGNSLTVTLEPSREDRRAGESTRTARRSDESRNTERSPEQTNEPRSPRRSTARTETEPARPRVATESAHRPAPTTSGGLFKVQAGTFANRTNADNLASDLREKGYKVEIKSVQVEDRTLHRVQLGGYKTREDAQELANDLSVEGYSPSIITERKEE